MSTRAIRPKREMSKKRRSRSARWTADQARDELVAWGQSGLSMAAYCRTRGIHVNRLYNWRARLDEWNGDRDSGSDRHARHESLRWVEATVDSAIVEPDAVPALTLWLGEGRIEVSDPDRVNTKWLVELARGLSEQLTR
jgi:hypothetical protein